MDSLLHEEWESLCFVSVPWSIHELHLFVHITVKYKVLLLPFLGIVA